MRLRYVAALTAAMVGPMPAWGHGPQIQTTLTGGKIVTRRIVDDANYHAALTGETTVYSMPLARYQDVWRAQPDGSVEPDLTPSYVGWPGFAYGYGYDATNNPAPFPIASNFVLGFTAGLKSWNGAAFVDAGVTEAEAYRGSSVAPSALAKTGDSAPFASLMFPGGAGVSFASSGADVHNTVHYRMAGDGSSITSPLADGVYLFSMQLSSTDPTVAASDPFHFVLSKGAAPGAVQAAIASLGVDPSRVQAIPEPTSGALAALGAVGAAFASRRRTRS
jgi:MYXO-CTERM domain-containing protein